ncbi:hypothetical protein AB4Z38_07000 [Arthrobacter sp. 2RAF6]|uniref:hypothetical protein n=1 Tax=Arthrobacter sp. 2RAF6 TaxID=3233002 RepID=UPI003F93CB0A
MGAVVHLTTKECQDQRRRALDRLNMTLEEARAQWEPCGCLVNGNYDDLTLLDQVRDMDYLLGEGDYT